MRLCCAVDFIVPNSHNMMVEAPSEIAKLKGECKLMRSNTLYVHSDPREPQAFRF